MKIARRFVMLALFAACASVSAQQLATRFSCSALREVDGQEATYADSGEIRLAGNRIDAFRWESSLFRRTHGFDCSIDEADGLQAEVIDNTSAPAWRVSLSNAQEARERRGYDFSHGFNCTVRLERKDDTLQIKPTCPALCGSRPNFSELSVDLKTGTCRYEE